MTGPLRILLVHERFAPDYAGGGEYVVLETARYLQAAGHAVTVLTAGDPALISWEGIATQRLPIGRARLAFSSSEVMRAAQDVDLIQCFTYYSVHPAMQAGRKLNKPVVLNVLALFDRTWLEMRGPFVGRLLRAMERYLMGLPMAARIFLSSESMALARELGVAQPGDVVIAPGISLADYHAAPDKSGVLFAGKLDTRKGIETVIAAARAMPEVPFRVLGWGPRYCEFAASYPPNVHLERFQDRLHLAGALAQARVFLFPTKAETFGLVLAEAMASGCAIVSTSGLPFEGARIAPDAPADAIDALRALWDDPQRCAAAGQANIARAQAYNWAHHVDHLVAVYRQVLGRRP